MMYGLREGRSDSVGRVATDFTTFWGPIAATAHCGLLVLVKQTKYDSAPELQLEGEKTDSTGLAPFTRLQLTMDAQRIREGVASNVTTLKKMAALFSAPLPPVSGTAPPNG